MAASAELLTKLRQGIDCCRRGDWNEGLRYLGQIAERGDTGTGLPGVFYSYLGYGIALREQRVREGLKLCRHSVKVEFYEADNYLNLARTCLLARDRSGAVRAVRDGLRIDPHHPGLLAVRTELGVRGQPMLPFLGRSHLVNRILGRLRHALRGD
ncbi:MAG: hypothetical protein QOF89_2129 [Acidobacteriota bacterium]|jgi:hypothetical protein|nr:hypothetical protein [Acidobacteriota bacterium]